LKTKGKLAMKNSKFQMQDFLFLTVVILLAVGFRLFLMRYRFAISFDEVNYLKLAASGAIKGFSNVLHPYWSPLFPFCVACFSKIVHNFELSGRLFSILCGVFVLIPIFFFTQFHFNKKAARYAVFLLAFYPSLAFFNTEVMSESLYTLLIISGIVLGWFALANRSWLLGIVVGFLFGLSYLTRPEGIGALIVFVGCSWLLSVFVLFRKKDYSPLLISLTAILAFVFVATPYVIYLHKTTGEWTISARGKALQEAEAIVLTRKQNDHKDIYQSLSDDNKEVLSDEVFHIGNFLQIQRQREKPVVKITPVLLVKKYTKNFYKILNTAIPQVFSVIFFVLAIIGFFDEAWSKRRAVREFYLLSYLVFSWFLVIPLFHVTTRYLLPLLPICFVWVGRGSEQLLLWIKKTLKQLLGFSDERLYGKFSNGIFLLIVLIGVFLPEFGRVIIRNPWSADYYADPVGQKEAGLWLKKHSSKTPVIMSRYHTVDFYAGNYSIAESVTIPQDNLKRVLAYAKYRGVDYIVLNERYKNSYPEIAFLLEGRNIPPDLKLVYKNKDKSGLVTVIYQLLKD